MEFCAMCHQGHPPGFCSWSPRWGVEGDRSQRWGKLGLRKPRDRGRALLCSVPHTLRSLRRGAPRPRWQQRGWWAQSTKWFPFWVSPLPTAVLRALQMLTGGQSGGKSVFSAQAWESEKPGLQSGATASCLCDLGRVNLCEPQLLHL